jgi:hypothetical protein
VRGGIYVSPMFHAKGTVSCLLAMRTISNEMNMISCIILNVL